MIQNPFSGRLLPAPVEGGYREAQAYIWCGSVIRGEDGRWHMFASRWGRQYGFGANWLLRCEIVRAASDRPEGPYRYEETVLSARDRRFFDGISVHNPCIRYFNGTYYLYYMGTTDGGPIPETNGELSSERFNEIWNRKRIGLATSSSVYGPWKRLDEPILMPRDCSHWDCTAVTNPAVAILPDGVTYMLYKSRRYAGAPLEIGAVCASCPEGPFERLSENPIFAFDHPDFHVEDPYLWFEEGKFRLLMKDDFKNGSGGVTGVWGSGFYAESDDCVHWQIAEDPIVYSRRILWSDGVYRDMPNAERPFLLLNEQGKPTHLFLATGEGSGPYGLDCSWNMVIPLKKES